MFMSHLTVRADIFLEGITAACSINPHYTIGVITLPALYVLPPTCHDRLHEHAWIQMAGQHLDTCHCATDTAGT